MLLSGEKEYLRELAKKQQNIANLPQMQEKTKLWYAHNQCKADRPIFTVEFNTFRHEFLPELKCASPEGRKIEEQLVTNLVSYEVIGDDNVMPNTFKVRIQHSFKPFNIDLVRTDAKLTNGKISNGYHLDTIINDMEKDFYKLEKSSYKAMPPKKDIYFRLCEDVLGDILPVELYFGTFGFSLTRQLFNLMGLEGLMFAVYDYPDLVHKAMRMLTDDLLEYMGKLEDNGALTLNNGNTTVGQGTRGFTTELPASDYYSRNASASRNKVLFRDMWGELDSQETVGLSPEMFQEFFLPYYKEISAKFGLLSYGCCEPVHSIWDNCLSTLSNLKKVSISPWCDEEFMGDKLRGSKIIYHRKPRPDYLGVDREFNEQGFKEHLLKTINAAKGCTLEFSYRDVYSLCGDENRAKKVYNTALEMFDKYWK